MLHYQSIYCRAFAPPPPPLLPLLPPPPLLMMIITAHHHSPCCRYDVTVVGVAKGVPSPASNTLSFVTPAANAPLNTGVAKNPSTVVVRLFAPTLPPLNGGSW